MPQALLPLIPDGATRINERISVVRENGECVAADKAMIQRGKDPSCQLPETDM